VRRRISFGHAALICALFLYVELILVSTMLPPACSVISAGVIWANYYESTDLHRVPEPYRIRINIPAFTLTVFSGQVQVKTYRIAVGKPASPSRIGTCKVVEKAKYPTWYPPDGRPPVPPGPDNPISCRWLGLSWSGYGIHGTNNPSSIGNAVTLGCIRMHDEDVMELFDMIPLGTKVEFVYETVEVSANSDEPIAMRLTVYRDLYQLGTNTVERVTESLRTCLSQVTPGLKPDMTSDTITIPAFVPDIDPYALAALLSAARGKPEPVPWQVRVELGAVAKPPHSSRDTEHVVDSADLTAYAQNAVSGNVVDNTVGDVEGVAFACHVYCDESGPCGVMGDSYRADFDVDGTICENTAHIDCVQAVDMVRVETDIARIEGDQVVVALRPVAEAFGLRVGWDGEWQAAIVNQNVATGVVREGRLYVSLDELTRLLDEVVVDWDPKTLILRISPILPATQL
jgi:hypothetical protein